jgi:pseudomonalisin
MVKQVILATIWVFLLAGVPAAAQGNAAGPTRAINDADVVPLPGEVYPLARPQFDAGLASPSDHMQRMILMLSLRPGAEADLDSLIRQQHDPSSPLYHQWLTPDQFGIAFGRSDEDINTIVWWLQQEGFTIDEVARGRRWINFTGTVGQVERAFHTEIHKYIVNGELHHANATPPSIPRALADLILGIVSLHDFYKKPMHGPVTALGRDWTSGSGNHYLGPGDFATIYNVNPLYGRTPAIDGTGQTVAVVARSNINHSDPASFRSFFGLPAKSPNYILNGTDPGLVGGPNGGEVTEADLDVQWTSAIAYNATVDMVISKSTQTTDGVDLSAQYIVDNNLAPIMTTSFGLCEQDLGSGNTFYANLWAQAASQGITPFVSSGDSGAAGCDSGSSNAGTVLAVNGLCSPPNSVCVGGTQFMDTSNPSLYWSSTNTASNSSALSYIPEQAWNESGSVGGSGLWATGGGASTLYAKPSWQFAPGVPNDSVRDVPDVSLSAASHDGYLVYQNGKLYAVGGTSASSPSFASLLALVLQGQSGVRQGNANAIFYPMGNNQYAGSGAPAVFHDITTGNNTVPGVTGYNAVTGFDLATGLGSVDVNQLVLNWGVPDFSVSTAGSATLEQGSSTPVTITTTVLSGFSSSLSLSASGLPSGVTVSFNPTTIPPPGGGTSTMTITASPNAALGTASVTVTASGEGVSHSAVLSLTVTTALASSAAFVKTDSTTQGDWQSSYGADGFNVLGDTALYPAYATVTPAGQSFYSWAASTSDVRALQKIGVSDRVAACWFSRTSFAVDVNLTDGLTHQVAVYLLDWDTSTRNQIVTVRDAQTGTVLDTRTMANFSGGKYLVWNINGHVVISFANNGGSNAVVSGLFFH